MSEREEPLWITFEQTIAIHSRQLRRFGGAPGLRDQGMLRSALERPINKWRYEQAELAELASAYAFGLAKNHAFVDGNKRTSMTVKAPSSPIEAANRACVSRERQPYAGALSSM